MKTERRHKLQTNELADTLGHELEYIRPYFRTILGVIIAVVAVVFAYAFLSSQQTAKNSTAWTNFFDVVASQGDDDLDKYADLYGDTVPGLWAKLAAANQKLNNGAFEMYRDRKEAEVQLDQAKKQFMELIELAKSDRMILRRAQLGLANTYEALNSPEEAEPIYEQLTKENAEDAVGMAAKERLRQMQDLVDQKWFSWYAKYTPPPIDPNGTGRSPFDLNNLPGQDNLRDRELSPTPGSLLEEELKDLENDKPLFPGFTPDTTTPDTTTPQPETPTEPEPAPDDKPAEPAPAEPAPAEPTNDAGESDAKSDDAPATDLPGETEKSSEAAPEE